MKSIYVDEPYVTKFKISSNDLDIIEYLKVISIYGFSYI